MVKHGGAQYSSYSFLLPLKPLHVQSYVPNFFVPPFFFFYASSSSRVLVAQLYIPSLQFTVVTAQEAPLFSPSSSLEIPLSRTDSLPLYGHHICTGLALYYLFGHAWSSKATEHRLCPSSPFLRNQCLHLSVLLPIDPPKASNIYRIRATRLQ